VNTLGALMAGEGSRSRSSGPRGEENSDSYSDLDSDSDSPPWVRLGTAEGIGTARVRVGKHKVAYKLLPRRWPLAGDGDGDGVGVGDGDGAESWSSEPLMVPPDCWHLASSANTF